MHPCEKAQTFDTVKCQVTRIDCNVGPLQSFYYMTVLESILSRYQVILTGRRSRI